jgi:hypothetical protein
VEELHRRQASVGPQKRTGVTGGTRKARETGRLEQRPIRMTDARTEGKAATMSDRTELLRALGRTEFTVRQMAELTGLSVESARGRISKYLDDGLVIRTSDVVQYVDDEGRPMRGRPAHLYRVR